MPFTIDYRRAATGMGILAGYGTVVLGATMWAGPRVSPGRRKALHPWTGVAWAASVAHTITAGTDAGTAWMVRSSSPASCP